ncbi:MAG: bifunctional glycosyltransferase/class I SAM-dependent methyltransferase [Treponema sp.]|nr:bifunctional glycosyltransferase/class I SAM-dependent methyltransferase [Treponema sp.]
MSKRAVIIQCRLSSTRLPGKALKLLDNKTVVDWVLTAMHKVKADRYFVATDEASFSALKPICEANDFEIFAGDLNDVLKRFCDLIKTIDCETIIRATADNPFLVYEAAEESAELFEKLNSKEKTVDYLTYSGLPHGSGVEIFSGSSLLKAITETDSPYDHEHVGPALYKHTDKYNCVFEPAPARYNFPTLRTTIDTYSDFLRAERMVAYGKMKGIAGAFTCEQVMEAAQSDFVNNPVVFCPSVEKGHGTGHLHRCIKAAIESKAFLFIPENASLSEVSSTLEQYKTQGLESWQIISQLPDETYKAVIVSDSFKLNEAQISEYKKQKFLISIDEGSDFSSVSDYLLDIIPTTEYNRKSNLTDSGFIEKPVNRHYKKVEKIQKVLICIGGEDPANLTEASANCLKKLLPAAKISVITSKSLNLEGIEILSAVKNLKEHLYEYDLVVTHYGLTAFEAGFAGCGVIMVSTTELHEKLARNFNYSFIPYNKLNEQEFKKALESKNMFPVNSLSVENKSLGDFMSEISKGQKLCCPVCGEKNTEDEIVSRNATRTYRRCNNCGMVYIAWTVESDKKYEKAYFFEDYKKQYGKTYQEDFDNIKNQCYRRVEEIEKFIPGCSEKKSLDIGCAYGPFLAAASEKGFEVYGTDISEDAVDYVSKKLKFSACVSAFPEINTKEQFNIEQFDVVSMWYVIEHFKDLKAVLTKVSELVKPNGIFAFSTPSGEGVSAVSDKDHFYEISPTDHYSVWEPSKANKILNNFGFEVVNIVSTGHHPERFPEIKAAGAKPGDDLWQKIDKLSHEKNLGDTVEIYCRKI